MKTFRTLLLAGTLLAGLTCMVAAQEKETESKGAKPGKVIVDTVKVTGTVKAIDPEKKTVTVEGPGGREVTVDAKNARNLDQVKVGDKVTMVYTQELALFVREASEPPSAKQSEMVNLAPKGQKPAGIMAQEIEVTGNVESVDAQKHTITLKGPAGNVRTFKVDPSVKNLGKVKKGDQVVLRYSEAVALSVTKP